jgi:GNAT superfamily N-acetyltransferase
MDHAIKEARAADAALGQSDTSPPQKRDDLTPWLCGVYVVPEHRRRGIASELVRHAMQVAKRLGVEALYLYAETDAAEALYRSVGWQVLERLAYSKLRVATMVAVLGENIHSTHTPGVGE